MSADCEYDPKIGRIISALRMRRPDCLRCDAIQKGSGDGAFASWASGNTQVSLRINSPEML